VTTDWIGAKELRSKSFVQTVVKSELIEVNCAAIGTSCGRIGVTYAETFAVSGETGVTLTRPSPGILNPEKS